MTVISNPTYCFLNQNGAWEFNSDNYRTKNHTLLWLLERSWHFCLNIYSPNYTGDYTRTEDSYLTAKPDISSLKGDEKLSIVKRNRKYCLELKRDNKHALERYWRIQF